MHEVKLYYAEGYSHPFNNKEDCEKYEKELKARVSSWMENTAYSKFDKLKHDLENCLYVRPGTICTCSYDSIMIKGMVKTCQDFVNENRQYLSHY